MSFLNFLRKSLIFLVLFFFLAIILFYWSVNQKLEKVPELKVSLNGPQTVKTFKILDYRISLINHSNVTLKNLKINVFLPENFLELKEKKRLITFETDLKPAEQKFFDFSGVFTHGEGILPIKINAFNDQLNQDFTFDVNVKEEGIEGTIDFPKELERQKEFQFKVTLKNNLDEQEDILFKIFPTLGFKIFKNENIYDSFEEKLTLEPGQKIDLLFNGIFEKDSPEGQKEIKASIFFIKENQILFSKDFSIFVNLIESPIIISSDLPQKIKDGQLNFSINVKNNTSKILDSSTLELEIIPDYFAPQTIKVSHNGIATFQETIKVNWSYERTSDLLKFLPEKTLTFSVSIMTDLKKDYYNLEIPFKVFFENKKEGIKVENIFTTKVIGQVSIKKEIKFLQGESPLKAQKESLFELLINVKPTHEDIKNLNLTFSFPYWVKIIESPGSVVEGNFYFKEDFVKNNEELQIPIKISVRPFLNQVGENLLLIKDLSVSGEFDFSQERFNVKLGDIFSGDKDIKNFQAGVVSF